MVAALISVLVVIYNHYKQRYTIGNTVGIEIAATFWHFVDVLWIYLFCVCLFSATDIVYNYNKWPINTNKSYTFPYIEKGSIYLIKVFPNEKKYQDSKEKIEEL